MADDLQDPQAAAPAPVPQGRVPLGAPPPEPLPPAPAEIGEAALRMGNPVISWLSTLRQANPDSKPDPDPNWTPYSVKGFAGSRSELYHRDNFLGDVNEGQVRARMARIDQEDEYNRRLAASGGAGTAISIAAGMLDPSFFVPILGEVRAVGEAFQFGKAFVRGGLTAAGQTTISETALHATQETRTAGETVANIGTNTLLMGLIGAGAGKLMSGSEHAAAVKGLDEVRKDFSEPGAVKPEAAAPAAPEAAREAPAAPAAPAPLPDRIRQAYLDSAGDYGQRANLADVRASLPDVAPAALESALRDMARDGEAHLQGLELGREITPEHRAAAMTFGGEPAHIMYMDRPAAPEAAPSVPQQIRDAYHGLKGGDAYVRLRALREALPDVPASEIDRALLDMQQSGEGTLMAYDDATNRRTEAPYAVDVSGDARHALSLNERPPAPSGLARDVGAAASDQRDMQLSRIGLPQPLREWLDKLPSANLPIMGEVSVGGALKAGDRALMAMSPTLRVFSSTSLAAKRAMGDLAESALSFTMHKRGITTSRGGVPLDRLIKMQYRNGMLKNAGILKDAFAKYRFGDEAPSHAVGRAAFQDLRGQGGTKLSYADFKREVSTALYSGDEHPFPDVQQAAHDIRSQIMDPVKKLAQATTGPDGKPMLATELEAPKGDQSFFPRSWNKEALAAKRNDARRIFADWLESEQGTKAAQKDRLADLQGRHEKLGVKIQKLEGKVEKAAVGSPERDLAEAALANAEDEHASIRAKMEKEIRDWKGDTTADAVAALKARDEAERIRGLKQEAGVYEGKGQRLTSADGPVDRAIKNILASDRDLSREELEHRASEIIDRINAGPDGRLPYDAPSGGPAMGPPGEHQQVRGSLNNRDFAIPTHLVADFVNHDMEHAMAAFLRTVLPDIHLTRRFGDVEMQDVFRRIDEEFDERSKTLTGERALRANDAERKAVIRDVAATRDRVRGVFGWSPDPRMRNAARIANDFRNYNAIADLGTSIFNRLTDAVNSTYRHGLMNVFRDGYLPYLNALVGAEKGFASASRKSMRDMQVGTDSVMGHLTHQLADVVDNYQPGNKFERGLAWAADKSMIVNLHGPWTDATKTIAGQVAGAEFLRASERFSLGTQTAKDVQRMAAAGIAQGMPERIWKSYSDGGGQKFGKDTHIADTASWKDRHAAEVFASAVGRDADISVLTPGLEKPLWMSSPVASLLGQFKSFVAAAHERVLIANLQQADARTVQGLVASVGMGMLSYRAYTLLAGQQVSDRPQDWIKEGISRSAIMGWFSEANAIQAKMTGGTTDAFRLIGADRPYSRRQSSSAMAELLGPTYSKLEGLQTSLSDALHGSWNAVDTHKVRQAMILQNLFAVRRLFDAVEDGVNRSLGVKPMDRSGTKWPGH